MKMGAMKKFGSAVALIAILVGTIGKYLPHYFLSLPFPLSIILWVSTGHEMPPYFMPDAWKEDEIDTWTKDGDLVVATGAKSGTTWMLYCTHQIRTKGTDTDDALYPDSSITTPWPDLRQSRAGTWAEQKDRYNTTIVGEDGRAMKEFWDHPSYPFRIFKSHYAPPQLPVRKSGGKKIKYMAMVRNGIDMAASLTTFYSSHTDKFRTLWGGFPPDITGEVDGDEPPAAVKDIMPGGPWTGAYFGYVKSWWPYRNDENVILLHYSDVRREPKKYISKVAKFLDVDLTSKELDTVAERCSMEHMKKVNKFNYKMPLNEDKGMWDVENDYIVRSGAIIKKGGVGTGGSLFSAKVTAQWKKAEEDEFGHDPAMLKWAREGGEFPSE